METLQVIPRATADELIGRERERAALEAALAAAAAANGGVLLIGGEAGVGKTRLASEVLAMSGLDVLSGAAERVTPPYGPLIAALRSYLRLHPDGLRDCGPLRRHLALLLPELGRPPAGSDRATVFEAIRCALATIAARAPAALLLDDLQWADDTTLELLAALAGPLEDEPLLIVGLYRSDEIPRLHPIRRLRSELRRAGRLRELTVEPLPAEHTSALTGRVLGAAPSASLAKTIHDRTYGVPFFVEELAAALAAAGRLREGPKGIELVVGGELPMAETVRDAVLLRTETLRREARDALAVASVAGTRFPLELVADLVDEAGLEEALEQAFLLEAEPGVAAFRHDLVREALYHSVAWRRRRSLHRELARRLEAAGGPPGTIAEHWLAAREPQKAWRMLLAAADASLTVHAHRDALQTLRLAVDVWPEGEAAEERLDALVRLGDCAHLCGDFGEAVRAWREVVEECASAGATLRCAEIQRRLASVHELQCAWGSAFAAREAAAKGFRACGLAGEAAAEDLAAATNLQSAGMLGPALELVAIARADAERGGRLDLVARAQGVEGLVRARQGDIEAALRVAREGLALALAENLTEAAAEIYERLGMILENSSNYSNAVEAWSTAFDFCQAHGVAGKAHLCLGCLAYVLRKTGEWERAIDICRDVLAAGDAPRSARCAAVGELGMIHVLRGEVKRGRPLLADALALADRTAFMIMRIDAALGLARADELARDAASAAAHARLLLELAAVGQDTHYPVAALRWAATFFCTRGSGDEAGACAELLQLGARTANGEALAALAHALGELALLGGDAAQASEHFARSLELLREIDLPLDRAETQLRTGVALASAGEREPAIEHLTDAYRAARKLGARPLASRAAEEVAALGERVDRRLGRRAAGELGRGGLTRRELEVTRLISGGRTNREIARELFLSTRTVETHVRHVLSKLDCRTRSDAARKAAELGLLG